MNTEKHFTDKRIYFLLLAMGGVFLALYTLLSFFNRMPYEDFVFISHTKEMGAINAMAHVYKVYSARWSAHTLAFYFSMNYENKYFLPLFNTITLITFAISIFLLIKRIFNGLSGFSMTKTALASYTGLFTICFFFSSYDIGQVWFWYMVNWKYAEATLIPIGTRRHSTSSQSVVNTV